MGSCFSKVHTKHEGPLDTDYDSETTSKSSNPNVRSQSSSGNGNTATKNEGQTRSNSRLGFGIARRVSRIRTNSSAGSQRLHDRENSNDTGSYRGSHRGTPTSAYSMSPRDNADESSPGMGKVPSNRSGSRIFPRSGTNSSGNVVNDSRQAVISSASNLQSGQSSTGGNSGASKAAKEENKILLLGSGESGKSTILKQMKIIHLGGYTQPERMTFKKVIYQNIIDCAQGVVTALEKLGVTFEGEQGYLVYHPDSTNDTNTNGPNEGIGESLTPSISRRTSVSDFAQSDVTERNFTPDQTPAAAGANGNANGTVYSNGNINAPTSRSSASSMTQRKAYNSVNIMTGHTLSDGEGPTGYASNNPWPVFKADFDYIKNAKVSEDLDPSFDSELAVTIENLWNHSVVRSLISEGRLDLYVMDSAPYFFANVRRISHPEYIPTVNDILRARIETSGTHSVKFNMGGFKNVNMIDVGGQR